MTGQFTPAERAVVDQEIRVLALAVHALDPAHADRLRQMIAVTESATPDPTHARLLVAGEIMRGITYAAAAPVSVGAQSVPDRLSRTLRHAESLGRALAPFALAPRGGLAGFFDRRRPRLPQEALRALLKCRAVAAASERRHPAQGASPRTPATC